MGLRSLFDLPVAMGWRHVLFANWPVDPGLVDAHLPAALDPDTYDGEAWLSVVPFTNVAVRPEGVPAGLGFRLPELNLRTYVTHGNDAGVYFFSLDADGILGVGGARVFHHLPYFYADISLPVVDGAVSYTSRRRHPGARPCDFAATYEPVGPERRSGQGSLEEFLTERYRYYTETPGGDLRYARVSHPRWPLHDADADVRRNEVFETNGFAHPDSDPLYLYSPGVDVRATGSRRPE
jgi:uncharacterized protein YqjF (DUF2071 family)